MESDPNRARPLESVPVTELLGRYAAILTELRERQVVRTANAPLGDYAEYLAHKFYGGTIEPNSKRSHDITADDGRLVQVKARTWGAKTSPSASFSAFRSFDFDVALLLLFDASTYALRWAREMTPDEVKATSRWSSHVNAHLLRVPLAERLGKDVTNEFRAATATG